MNTTIPPQESAVTQPTPRPTWRFALLVFAALGAGFLLNSLRPAIPFMARPGRLAADPASLEVIARTSTESSRDVELQLTNSGDLPVRILSVSSSCGCTQVTKLDGTVLAAGSSSTLKAHVTLGAGEGNQAIIQVQTDSPVTPVLSIPVKIGPKRLSDRHVAEQPTLLALQGGTPGDPVTHEFDVEVVEPPDSGEPWLQGFDSTREEMIAEIVETGEPQRLNRYQSIRRFRIRVTALTPNQVNDDLVGQLHWRTSTPIPNANPIPFRVSLDAPVRFIPEELRISMHENAKFPLETSLILKKTTAVEVDSITSNVPWLVASIAQNDDEEESNLVFINVRLTGPPRPDEHARLLIKTRQPDSVEHEVAVVVNN